MASELATPSGEGGSLLPPRPDFAFSQFPVGKPDFAFSRFPFRAFRNLSFPFDGRSRARQWRNGGAEREDAAGREGEAGPHRVCSGAHHRAHGKGEILKTLFLN